MDWKSLPPGDPALIDKIVQEYMSQGKFDELRRKMLAEVDTMSSYHNVKQRMENSVRSHLDRQRWRPDLPKNQLRDGLKRHVAGAPFLRPGVRRTISLLVSKSTMDSHRADLEAIARDLLGISEEKNEVMETQPEPVDSPDDNRMVIATDEDTMHASDDEKLVGAMEDLSIPEVKEESQPETLVMDQELSDEESDHSIIKQMSPISVGTPSPPGSPQADSQTVKRASDFVGKIPKVKKEEDVKKEEEKPKVKEEKRERKSSSRRSYKSSRRDSDHRSRDRDRRRDSDKRDKRDSKDKDRGKKDDRHKKRDEKPKPDEEKPIKPEAVPNEGNNASVPEKDKEQGKNDTPVVVEEKNDTTLTTMSMRSRLRGPVPVTETSSPSGTENVYSKKYLRPARRDIR